MDRFPARAESARRIIMRYESRTIVRHVVRTRGRVTLELETRELRLIERHAAPSNRSRFNSLETCPILDSR